MTFGSLFAGIGGMDLGLERAGLKCVWQVEIDDYCRRVLAKHWPNVSRWDDVRTFPPAGEWGCDLIAGGFPCQDISHAGYRAGIGGKRSGLWSEYTRIIRLLRPRFVFVENVAALLVRGADRVLGDLAACGYDAGGIALVLTSWGQLSTGSVSGFWHTPTTRDYKGQSGLGNRQRRGRNGKPHVANLCDQIVDLGRQDLVRSVQFREWLMGFPIGWTGLEDSETPSSPKSPSG